jgi:YjbE family integral membrane protein
VRSWSVALPLQCQNGGDGAWQGARNQKMDLSALASAFPSPSFWFAAVQVVWVNLLLSGDNAVVIALASRALPARERFWAMAIGAGFASVLLIVLTLVASLLLRLRYLQLAGGMALLWIAAKLLVPRTHEDEGSPEAAQDLRRAVQVVVIADIVMSLDNVLAVAALAKGQYALLIVGLAVSVPVVIGGSAAVLWALQRIPLLVWGGAAILGSVGGSMLVTDPAVMQIRPHYLESVAVFDLSLKSAALGLHGSVHHVTDLVNLGAAMLGAALVVLIGAVWRARHHRAAVEPRKHDDEANKNLAGSVTAASPAERKPLI